MGDGNYSLDLSLFFLYNGDTDNVGKQSFNDCYGQLTNVDDVLIVAFFGVEVISRSLSFFELSDSFLQDLWCEQLWVYYFAFAVIDRINCRVDNFVGFVYHNYGYYQLAVNKAVSGYSVHSYAQISS